MKSRFASALAALVVAGTNTGCSQDLGWSTVLKTVRSNYSDVEHISTDSLASWLTNSAVAAPIVLDTRESDEFAVSHIAGALRIDPDDMDFSLIDSLDRDAPIVAYCSVGYRSSEVVRQLEAAGFTNVSNLEGSIFKWANEGREVVRDGAAVQSVHPFDRVWGRLLKEELRAYSGN